jgi:nitrate reductase NapE
MPARELSPHSPNSGRHGARARDAERRREILLFLLLAVVIWPFIAVGVVAGWGFVVWMYYLFTGPPGPV